jgi:hypothetical protein
MSTLGHVYRESWHGGVRCHCHDMTDGQLSAATAAARQARPSHHPATATLRESWSVLNPFGKAIHYPSEQEALTAAQTGIY